MRGTTCSPTARAEGSEILKDAAERTGGEVHIGQRFFRSSALLGEFRRIFEDFRQSYILRYSPVSSPAPGWHAIDVAVPSVRDSTVRARKGYFK